MDTSIKVTATKQTAPEVTISPTVQVTARIMEVSEQRFHLFKAQEQNIQRFFDLYYSDNPTQNLVTPTTQFYIANKKSQFIETHKLDMARCLNSRDVVALEQIEILLQNLHVVDDLLMSVVAKMPAQLPIGWQLTSLGQNLLNLPTVGQLRQPQDRRKLEQSVAATVLQFFGVASFTLDKGYFIGHILGYLFCCYYFAQLGVGYGVSALTEKVALDYAYDWVAVPQLVRLLQELDESLKTQVYQLAIYCAQISEYAIDKRIEKMLISEVNSFNKHDYKEMLNEQITYDSPVALDLFSPLKPFK